MKKKEVFKSDLPPEEQILGRVGFLSVSRIANLLEMGVDDTSDNPCFSNAFVGHVDQEERIAKFVTCQHIFSASTPSKPFQYDFEVDFERNKDEHDAMRNISTETIGSSYRDCDIFSCSLRSINHERSIAEVSHTFHKNLVVELDSLYPVEANHTKFFQEAKNDEIIGYYIFCLRKEKDGASDRYVHESEIISRLIDAIKYHVDFNFGEPPDSDGCYYAGVYRENPKKNFPECIPIIMKNMFVLAVRPSYLKNCIHQLPELDTVIFDLKYSSHGVIKDMFDQLPRVIFEELKGKNVEAKLISNTLGSFDDILENMKKIGGWHRSGFHEDLDEFGNEFLSSTKFSNNNKKEYYEELETTDFDHAKRKLLEVKSSFCSFVDYMQSRVGKSKKMESLKLLNHHRKYWKKKMNIGQEEEVDLDKLSRTIQEENSNNNLCYLEMKKKLNTLIDATSDFLSIASENLISGGKGTSFSLLIDSWYTYLSKRFEFENGLIGQVKESLIIFLDCSKGNDSRKILGMFSSFMKAVFDLISISEAEVFGFAVNDTPIDPEYYAGKSSLSMEEVIDSLKPKVKGKEYRPERIIWNIAKKVPGIKEWSARRRGEDDDDECMQNEFVKWLGKKYGYGSSDVIQRKIIIDSLREDDKPTNFGLLFGVVCAGDSGAFICIDQESAILSEEEEEEGEEGEGEEDVVRIVGFVGFGKMSIEHGVQLEFFVDTSSAEWREKWGKLVKRHDNKKVKR